MRKRVTYIFIMFLIVFLSLNNGFIYAESITTLDEKIRKLDKEQTELQQKKEEINKDKQKVDEKMDRNKEEQYSIQQKLDKIEGELIVTRAEIQAVEANINSTEKQIEELEIEIKQLNSEIKELERRIEKRNKLLKERLRSIQESGGKSQFISVLLGAQNFTDFIMRTTAVNTIMDQDRSIMEEHADDQLALERKKAEVETKKVEVESKKAELEEQKSTLVGLKTQLDEQKSKQAKLKQQLEKEYAEMEDYKLSLEEQQQIFNAESAAIEKLKAQAEKEKAAIIEEQQKVNQSNQPQNNYVNPTPVQGNGLLLKPLSYPINSGYKTPHRPSHKGVDMAAPKGTAVMAAESGIVTKVVTGCGEGRQWYSCGGGFGNVVYITHLVQGRTITTVYAHLSSVNVSVNQTVSRGQIIGGVGNTGDSRGYHLHFEVHEGGFDGPRSARNPQAYF